MRSKKNNNYFQSFTTIDVHTLPRPLEMILSGQGFATFDGTKNWQKPYSDANFLLHFNFLKSFGEYHINRREKREAKKIAIIVIVLQLLTYNQICKPNAAYFQRCHCRDNVLQLLMEQKIGKTLF